MFGKIYRPRHYLGFSSAILLLVFSAYSYTARGLDSTYSFSDSAGYSFDASKIEFSGNVAQLKEQTSSWYNSSWKYRKKITIDHTKVSADQTNFPVLISTTDSSWKDTSNSGHAGQSDGGDFVITSSDGTTKLSHEIETYDNTSGQLIAWVKVPTLSSSADTELYIYYGNDSVSNQWDAANVWDSNFKGVWHLPNGTTLSATDSTAVNNGTASGTAATAGQVDGAASYSNFGDNISVGTDSSLNITGSITISAWIYPTSLSSGNNRPRMFNKGSGTGYFFGIDNANTTAGLGFGINAGGVGTEYAAAGNVITLNAFQHVVATYNGSGQTAFYVNGSAVSADVGAISGNITSNSSTARIGNRDDLTRQFTGKIDEMRISNTVRSASWVATEYNNQSSPPSFYSIGSEATKYDTATPTIIPANYLPIDSISSFSETATKNGGSIKYQLSNDGGNTWHWFSSGWQVATDSYLQANDASDIGSNLGSFPLGSKRILWKAYLVSDGSQLVQLSSIDISYAPPLANTSGSSSGRSGSSSGPSLNTSYPNTNPTSSINISNINAADISAKIEDISKKIQVISAQIPSGQSSTSKYFFSNEMSLHDTGEEVRQLQIFLNDHGFLVAESGPGSKGSETDYFGIATYEAVKRFQEFYLTDVLAPYGYTKGNGKVGPNTLKKINFILGD
jgi:hypothetical protein